LSAVTIWVKDGELKLRMPHYDQIAVEDFKRSFCAEWRSYEKKTRTWSLIITKQIELEEFCRRHFARIVYLGEMPTYSEEAAYASELADLIEALPLALVKKIYKLLVFELHPDRGGDPELFRRATDAWEKI
jgi:hypothetical protein